jgi:hypothetical protein
MTVYSLLRALILLIVGIVIVATPILASLFFDEISTGHPITGGTLEVTRYP